MRRWTIVLALLFLAPFAWADRVGYQGIFDCRVESEVLSAEHHHDWSRATRDARWEMISTTQDVFTPKNTYASLVVTDKNSGAVLFRVPTPALRYLWISGDSKFIVGRSDIQLWNPVQVVVFNSKGRLALARHVGYGSFPGVSVSASNWVHWYKETEPKISIETRGDSYTLHVEGNNGADRTFEFKDPQ